MAFSLRQFLRLTPPRTLKSYCKSRRLDLPDAVDRAADEKTLVKALFEAIGGLPFE